MFHTFKKIMGMAVVIGLIGGGMLGASKVSYADVKNTIVTKGWGHFNHFFKDEKKVDKKMKEKVAANVSEKVAAYLGMKKEDVEALMKQQGMEPREVAMAAVIAEKRNQPLSKVVITIKTKNNWEEVFQAYQLQPKDVRMELRKLFPHLGQGRFNFVKNHPAVTFKALADYLGRQPQDIQADLYKSKVHPKGSIFAAILSKASGKSFESVLALKTDKNTWKDVAAALHVSEDQLKAERQKFKQKFRIEVKDWREQFKAAQ